MQGTGYTSDRETKQGELRNSVISNINKSLPSLGWEDKEDIVLLEHRYWAQQDLEL